MIAAKLNIATAMLPKAALVVVEPIKERPRLRRRRWLPGFDIWAICEAARFLSLDDGALEIALEHGIPGGAYYRREDDVDYVGLDWTLSPSELSKALWHELRHAQQARMYPDAVSWDRAVHWSALEAEAFFPELGSWFEEQARKAEEWHYDLPLFHMEKEIV